MSIYYVSSIFRVISSYFLPFGVCVGGMTHTDYTGCMYDTFVIFNSNVHMPWGSMSPWTVMAAYVYPSAFLLGIYLIASS